MKEGVWVGGLWDVGLGIWDRGDGYILRGRKANGMGVA